MEVFASAPWLEGARGDLGFVVSAPRTIGALAPAARHSSCCWQRSARAARRAAAAARAAFVAHVAFDAGWHTVAPVRGTNSVRVARLRLHNFRAFRYLRALLLRERGEGRATAAAEASAAPPAGCYESYICPFSEAFFTALSANGCVRAAVARVTAPGAAYGAHAACAAHYSAACGVVVRRKWFRSVRLRLSNGRRDWSHVAVRRTTPEGAALKAMPVVLLELSYREPHAAPGGVRPMAPALAWDERLARLQATAAYAVALNAYISTLGGGYFLCAQGGVGATARAHMANARRMALRQLAVALEVGNAGLASQCRMHLIYISIQCRRTAAEHLIVQCTTKALCVVAPIRGCTLTVAQCSAIPWQVRAI